PRLVLHVRAGSLLPLEIMPSHFADAMHKARCGDHSGPGRCQNGFEQETCKGKMAEMIRSKLHFKAIRRGPIRRGHDPSIVAKNMQKRVAFAELLRECLDRSQTG